MKKKLWIALVAIVLVVAAFFVFKSNDFFQGTKGEKEIFITVKNLLTYAYIGVIINTT